MSFRERSASPPTDVSPSPTTERELEIERGRLAAAIEKFYHHHAPHKAHQAVAIAKHFSSKSGGVEELFEKLRGIYGAIPNYRRGGGGGDDDDDDGSDLSLSMSESTDVGGAYDDDGDASGTTGGTDDDDDESSESLSKYDHTRRDSVGPAHRSPVRRPRRVSVRCCCCCPMPASCCSSCACLFLLMVCFSCCRFCSRVCLCFVLTFFRLLLCMHYALCVQDVGELDASKPPGSPRLEKAIRDFYSKHAPDKAFQVRCVVCACACACCRTASVLHV